MSYKHRFLEKVIHGTSYCIGVFKSAFTVCCCNRKLKLVLVACLERLPSFKSIAQ